MSQFDMWDKNISNKWPIKKYIYLEKLRSNLWLLYVMDMKFGH